MNRRLRGAVFLALAAAFGCSPPAPPPPVREASPQAASGLRPLTSRDEAKPFDTSGAPASGGLPAGHPPIGASIENPSPGKAVAGIVSISLEIQGRAKPTDILYLIARSRPTNAVVAVRRETGVRFPHSFELTSADAMVADQPFVGPFDITARLSKSGDALPAPGDLEGTAPEVAEGARTVSVVIERVRQ